MKPNKTYNVVRCGNFFTASMETSWILFPVRSLKNCNIKDTLFVISIFIGEITFTWVEFIVDQRKGSWKCSVEIFMKLCCFPNAAKYIDK